MKLWRQLKDWVIVILIVGGIPALVVLTFFLKSYRWGDCY